MSNNKKQYILSSIGFLFYIICFSRLYFNISDIIVNLATVIAGSIGYIYSLKKSKINYKVYFYSILILVVGLVSIIINQNMTFTQLIKSFFYVGIGLLFLNGKISIKIAQICFYSLATFLIIKMLLGIPPDAVIVGKASRNYISVTMIILISFLYISYRNVNIKKSISFAPAILFLIICTWTTNRTGILCAFLLVLGIYVVKFIESSNKSRVYYLSFAIGFTFIVAIFVIFNLELIAQIFSRFYTKGLESERGEIWRTYLSGALKTIENLIFAPSINSYEYIIFIEKNLHNSFLQMYSSYGLIFSIINIILIQKAIMHYFFKKNYIALFIIIIFLVRAFFDKLFFSELAEPLLFYLIFYPYYFKKQKLRISDYIEIFIKCRNKIMDQLKTQKSKNID